MLTATFIGDGRWLRHELKIWTCNGKQGTLPVKPASFLLERNVSCWVGKGENRWSVIRKRL